MKSPLEALLDNIDWQPVPDDRVVKDEHVPYATHQGVLNLGGVAVKVVRMNDGTERLLRGKDAEKLLGGKA